MARKFILASALLAVSALCIASEPTRMETGKLVYDIRLGYNIGGTMPLGMPACIRHLNSYSPRFNPQVGAYVSIPIKNRFGIMPGIRVERKSMGIDVDAKAYYVEMVRGGEPVVGYFTGKVNIKTNLWNVTIPVMASYDVSERVSLRLGPYISFALSRNFAGYAYDGYLRSISSPQQIDQEYLSQSGLDLSNVSPSDLINLLHDVPHKYQYPTGEKLNVGTTSDKRGDFDFSDDMRHVYYGIDLGVDWNITHSVGLYADFQWGLNGIFKNSFTTVSYTMYPLFATVGVFKKL